MKGKEERGWERERERGRGKAGSRQGTRIGQKLKIKHREEENRDAVRFGSSNLLYAVPDGGSGSDSSSSDGGW